MKKLSIITGTMDRSEPFENMIRSVVENTQDVDFEIVVADASRGRCYTNRNGDWPMVRVIEERERLHHVKAYNTAFREATGGWVIWLNDDCEVEKEWASRSIAFMERNPGIGLGCIAYSENDGPCHARTYHGMHYANFGILRRSLGDSVGWFDECCVQYGGDNSLAYRVLLGGLGVAPIPWVGIKHWVRQDIARGGNVAMQPADVLALAGKYDARIDEMRAVYDRAILEIVP